MTTITALNVRLGMDVSNFSEGANLAKAETNRVAAIMRQSVPASEKYKQELDLINRAFSETGKASREYANAMAFLNQKYAEVPAVIKPTKEETDRLAAAEKKAADNAKFLADVMDKSTPSHVKFSQELQRLNSLWPRAQRGTQEYAAAFDYLTKKHQMGKYSVEAMAKAQQVAAESAKKLKEETAKLAEAEQKKQATMDRGKQLMLSVQTAQEKHTRSVSEYLQLLKSGAITQETFFRAVHKSSQAMHDATKATKESSTANNSALSSIKQMAAAYLGFQTVTKSINLATQVEDATVAFEVLTGSVNDGKVLFEQVREFAERSPVTFSNATQATRTMLSFGVATQDVQKNLQMLSDVTGGNNERFKNLSLAFAQMTSAGRLLGQDLRQMVDAGFNPLQQISKMTGESLVDLKKRMEDGAITSDEVRSAFEAATAAGGMYHGMTERLSQTVGGKLNIAMSDLEKKLAEAGKAMGPMLSQLLDVFTRLQPVMSAVVNLIDGISQGLGFVLAGLTDAIDTLKNFAAWDFTEVTAATDKFLDDLEKRERERAEAAAQNVNNEFDQKKRAAEELAAAEKKAAQEAAAAARAAMEEQEKAAKKAFEENQKRIEAELKARKKAAEEAQKAQQRAAEAAQKAFQKELEDARKAALDFFEKRKRELDERRAAVAQGPGAGMEVGSAEAAKFSADMVNSRISAAAVPEDPIVLQRDLAKKTAELLIANREANAKAQIQIELAQAQLAEMRENGFRRIR